MRTELRKLIDRMCVKEPFVDSDKSVSWHAFREAEQLADAGLIGELADFVEIEPDKERRRAAYFILGKLGARLQDGECTKLLIRRSRKEKDRDVLSSMFDGIRDHAKPQDLDLEPIFERLKEKRWIVRHSAIQALERAEAPAAEDKILELLAVTEDPYDQTYCHSTLSSIGTEKSLPLLERGALSRKPNVKHTAKNAIESIRKRAGEASLNS